jgi:putative toxin-antitoxin system antitoxin component (TIGR02293 family)
MSRQTNLALASPPPRRALDLRTLVAVVRERILRESPEPFAKFEPAELIESVLKGLPSVERDVLRLYYFEEQTIAEIGTALDLPLNRVRRIKDSARRRIRRVFDARSHQNSVIAHAVAVFGNEHKASHWLGTPLHLLGGRSPAQALAEDGEVSAVDRILTRIEHNIPS